MWFTRKNSELSKIFTTCLIYIILIDHQIYNFKINEIKQNPNLNYVKSSLQRLSFGRSNPSQDNTKSKNNEDKVQKNDINDNKDNKDNIDNKDDETEDDFLNNIMVGMGSTEENIKHTDHVGNTKTSNNKNKKKSKTKTKNKKQKKNTNTNKNNKKKKKKKKKKNSDTKVITNNAQDIQEDDIKTAEQELEFPTEDHNTEQVEKMDIDQNVDNVNEMKTNEQGEETDIDKKEDSVHEIKTNDDYTPENNEPKKYREEARIFCTFKNKVHQMYKEIKRTFVGDLCHAIVFGTPLIIKNQIHKHTILLDNYKTNQLQKISSYKKDTLLVVIMKHNSYDEWSRALDSHHRKQEVDFIMNYVNTYDIDGIQFSNLQPTAKDQLDTDMLCKIVLFFKELYQHAKAMERELKIGISIISYSQSILSGFKSFEELNKLVSWYTIKTISMVKCTPSHAEGTSPLHGEVSLESTINELKKTNIEWRKIIIGIQLYPQKIGDLQPSSYNHVCSNNKGTWCAPQPEQFFAKGEFLRKLDIWGVQLYYIESDDHKNRCECNTTFPMIRGLLRGMAKRNPPDNCIQLDDVKNEPSTCSMENPESTDLDSHQNHAEN